jgi:tetratricopeptide (TPR) repeat protein
MSSVLEELGRPEEAMAACERAISLLPEDGWNYVDPLEQKVWLLKRFGEPGNVTALVDNILGTMGQSSEWWRRWGARLRENGEYAQAIRLYDRALCVEPSNGDAIDSKVEAFRSLGKMVELWVFLDDCVARFPGDAMLRFHRGQLLFEFGLYSEAEKDLWEAVFLDSEDARARKYLGLAIWRLGRRGEALALLWEAARQAPYDCELWSDIGLLLMETDQTTRKVEAFFYLNKALRMNPDSVRALSNMVQALTKTGHLKEAGEITSRIGELTRQNRTGTMTQEGMPQ